MRQALSDIGVVEIGSGVAASWCGKVFADLGADVVKVEPPAGDALRAEPASFAHLNTNKRSAVIEPSPAAADAIWSLIERADLVVEAPGLGSLGDWGIGRDDVFSRFPAACVVGITGFGATGPYADYAWSDIVAQALSGALLSGTMLRDPARGPVRLPMAVEETAVGHTAALGALAAVLRSRATGVGAFVDCSAVEALASPPTRTTGYLGWEYRNRALLDAGTNGETLLPLGLLPCADGYVSMMMTPQQLREMLAVLDSPELTEAFSRPDAFARPESKEILDGVLYPWLLERTRQEITAAAQAAGWPVTGAHEPAEVLAAAHLHQRGFWVTACDEELGPLLLPGAPYRFTEGGWKLRRAAPRLGDNVPPTPRAASVTPGPQAPRDPATPPLRGMRVVDFTTVWSGPSVTLLLADLGAEVIRVESPLVFPPTTRGYLPRPDPHMLLSTLVGGYGPIAPGREDRPYNRHSMYNAVNRGKLSCTLDVRHPEQRELFLRLVAESDVFVENLKSTTLHQIGIHETELLERNPRLIVLRLPPAGLSGDWSRYTGFGGQFDGLTSFASLCGHRGTELVESPTTNYMDSVTGPVGAFAVLAALHYRDATGRGQLIELAQSENVIAELGDVFVGLQFGVAPERLGNRDRRRAPQGVYLCADGQWIALTVTDDAAWGGLTSVLGRDDLARDERLAHAAGRQAAHDELDEAILAWAATVDAGKAFLALQDAGVAAAPVADDAMLAADPQIVARGWIRPLSSDDVGTFDHLGQAFRGVPLAWDRGAPTLGQDNEYVFKTVLGVTADEYERLVAQRVATNDYLDTQGKPV